jgi:hypothetical protein
MANMAFAVPSAYIKANPLKLFLNQTDTIVSIAREKSMFKVSKPPFFKMIRSNPNRLQVILNRFQLPFDSPLQVLQNRQEHLPQKRRLHFNHMDSLQRKASQSFQYFQRHGRDLQPGGTSGTTIPAKGATTMRNQKSFFSLQRCLALGAKLELQGITRKFQEAQAKSRQDQLPASRLRLQGGKGSLQQKIQFRLRLTVVKGLKQDVRKQLKEGDHGKIFFQPMMVVEYLGLAQDVKIAASPFVQGKGGLGKKFQRGGQLAFGFSRALGDSPYFSRLQGIKLDDFIGLGVRKGVQDEATDRKKTQLSISFS